MAELDHHHGCDDLEALSLPMRHQQELVTQLRALVLPSLVINGGSSSSSLTAELAVQLFDDVIGCNTSVLSRLQLAAAVGNLLSGSTGGGPPAGGEIVVVDDDKSLVKKKNTASIAAASERLEEPISKKRRRNDGKRSRSLVTHVPDYDGHQWRKYGQKKINGTQHVRSYYRCTYRERNCLATKTVQEQDRHQNGSSNFSYGEEDQTAKYNVVYYGDHTCMGGDSMISNNSNVDLHNHHYDVDHDQSSSGEEEEMTTARRTTPEVFQEFDEGDLDVPALLEVLDDSLLNWESLPETRCMPSAGLFADCISSGIR